MENFKFCCPHCEQRIEADESMRGELANCPCCNEEIVVDELSPWEDDVVAKDGSCNLSETIAVEKKQVQNDNQPIKDVESSIEDNNTRDLNQSFEIKESLPDKKKSKVILISVLIAIPFLLLVLGGISFILYQQRQAEAQRQAEFQMRLREFATCGHELQSKSRLGITHSELGNCIAKIDSQWRICCEMIPENHPGRSNINRAIKLWTICYSIWKLKLTERYPHFLNDEKLSPNDRTFLQNEFAPLQHNKIPIETYDNWISTLLGRADMYYQEGYELLALDFLYLL